MDLTNQSSSSYTFLHPIHLILHYSTLMEPDFSSTVDTSSPFSSVKEAVAIFGERLLVGEIYSTPKPFSVDTTEYYYSPSPPIKRQPSWRFSSSPTPIMKPKLQEDALVDTVKKLEEELEKTKAELKLVKERGSETEVALATLNAELHKNMSKLAQAEAMEAGKATKNVRFEIERDKKEEDEGIMNMREEKKEGSNIIRRDSQTLAHILSLGENDDHLFGGGGKKHKKKKRMKHKPIIPLVADLFSSKRKKSFFYQSP